MRSSLLDCCSKLAVNITAIQYKAVSNFFDCLDNFSTAFESKPDFFWHPKDLKSFRYFRVSSPCNRQFRSFRFSRYAGKCTNLCPFPAEMNCARRKLPNHIVRRPKAFFPNCSSRNFRLCFYQRCGCNLRILHHQHIRLILPTVCIWQIDEIRFFRLSRMHEVKLKIPAGALPSPSIL